MEIHVFEKRQEMGAAAGKAIESRILGLAKGNRDIRMVFGAAPSQDEMLAWLRASKLIPWDRITAFHMDEYIGLPADAPQAFGRYLRDRLFDHVPLKAVHLIDGNQTPEQACAEYTALFNSAPIDIVCLGIGENGHIAFNDPPVADFNDQEVIKPVDLDLACRQQQVNDGCFANLEQVPKQALTLTVPALCSGRDLFCVVPGERKRAAVQAALYDPISTACPATVLRKHSSCQLFLDVDAYGKR